MTTKTRTDNILDPAALDNLRDIADGDSAFLADLIGTFLEDAPQMLADMRQGLENQDMVLLRRAAHSLKSNSIQFGAIPLSELCKQLEAMSKTNSLEGAEEKLVRAKAEYEQVQAALQSILNDQK